MIVLGEFGLDVVLVVFYLVFLMRLDEDLEVVWGVFRDIDIVGFVVVDLFIDILSI